jgi:MYXO-CTERM domain-containing protein
MTGDLLSNGGGPMKTRLSLIDTDGVTVLATSAEEDGRAFVELRTPGTPGSYYLKVEGDVGRFRVAVAPRAWFDPTGRKTSGEDGGGCGCHASRGHGEAALALLVLTWLGVRRVRRR